MRSLRPTGCILLPSRCRPVTCWMIKPIKQAAGGCSQHGTSSKALPNQAPLSGLRIYGPVSGVCLGNSAEPPG